VPPKQVSSATVLSTFTSYEPWTKKDNIHGGHGRKWIWSFSSRRVGDYTWTKTIMPPTCGCSLFFYFFLLAGGYCYCVLPKYTVHEESICLLTRLWFGEPRNRGSIPCTNKRFFSSQSRGQIWEFPSTLFKEYWLHSCRFITIFYMVGNEWIINVFFHTSLRHSAWLTLGTHLYLLASVCDLIGWQPSQSYQAVTLLGVYS